ncbi:MAG: EamA family transporter [Fibrobacteres bacterium]|nr:EamA family transporter [Fibrobacterota bacterium]
MPVREGLTGKSEERGVLAAYLAVCLFWGSTYLAMRVAVTHFPPDLFAGIRHGLSGAMILAWCVATGKRFPATLGGWARAAVPGILLLTIPNGIIMHAEQWVHSGITAVLLSITPLFVAVLEIPFERKNRMGIPGATLLLTGFVGTAILVLAGKSLGAIDLFGAGLILLASLFWAIGTMYSKFARYEGDLSTRVGIQMVTASLILIPFGSVRGEWAMAQWSHEAAWAMAFLVVFGSIVGYTANMYVLVKWPASLALTSAYVNPVVAVILGVLLLDERLDHWSFLGILITLGSVVGMHFWRFRRTGVLN